MTDRRNPSTQVKVESDKRSTAKERPQRGPDPDTLEGPGDRQEEKGESDARNKTTRRGER